MVPARLESSSLMATLPMTRPCCRQPSTEEEMKIILAFLGPLLLTACATSYQSSSFTGGFTETQLDENVFRVSFRGNGYTSRERAADFAMLRSAELAMSHGYKYFAIVDSANQTDTYVSSSAPNYTTNFQMNSFGNATYGTARTHAYGGQTMTFHKPSSSNTIVCFKEKPAQGMAYSAEFVAKSVRQKYGLVGDQAAAGVAAAQASSDAGSTEPAPTQPAELQPVQQ